MRKIDVLIGLQWGDEGKGKIVDFLAPYYDIIARFQGGPNAGHTLEFNNTKHILHTIPSGIFHEHITNVIGNGVVIDPIILNEEVEKIKKIGINVEERLIISSKAHLILPTHKLLDKSLESLKGSNKIGSTLKGIGPCYTDKTSRNGIRVGDVFSKEFRNKYESLKKYHLKLLEILGCTQFEEIDEDKWFEGIEVLRKFKQGNVEYLLYNSLREDKKILAEGAQGTMLDIDFGTYPYVTSSNTICAGFCTGLGLAPIHTGKVYGIFKAYTTRVGAGPFPTELNGELGELLRKKGNEYGSTTGRARRCGWLDLVALKYAIMINGVTDLIITKADVLANFSEIKIAIEYLTDDNQITSEIKYLLTNVTPVFKSFKSWKFNENSSIPQELLQYLEFIENYTETPITILSTGPDRTQTIWLKNK